MRLANIYSTWPLCIYWIALSTLNPQSVDMYVSPEWRTKLIPHSGFHKLKPTRPRPGPRRKNSTHRTWPHQFLDDCELPGFIKVEIVTYHQHIWLIIVIVMICILFIIILMNHIIAIKIQHFWIINKYTFYLSLLILILNKLLITIWCIRCGREKQRVFKQNSVVQCV